MNELVQVGEHSYYVNCGAKVGVYKASENEVYIIDSGNDKDMGRGVKKLLTAEGWTLVGIINTHSHADHIGGNQLLQRQYGCKVFSSGVETAFIRWPFLEPALLYGGYPIGELRHKFLMAQPSEACDITDPDFPAELRVVRLPGHSPDMIGVVTPDGTAFVGDCVSSAETLEKYQIGYIYNVADYLQTLDSLKELEAKVFVPAHAPACESILPLAELNRKKVYEIAETIIGLCARPRGFEELLTELFNRYGLSMSCERYALVGSTLRSYLAWLHDGGRAQVRLENNRLLWVAADA